MGKNNAMSKPVVTANFVFIVSSLCSCVFQLLWLQLVVFLDAFLFFFGFGFVHFESVLAGVVGSDAQFESVFTSSEALLGVQGDGEGLQEGFAPGMGVGGAEDF